VRRFGLALGLFLVAGWPAGAWGAVQGIGVSPTSQEVALDPGGTYRGHITVINDGATDVNYRVYATDYRVTGETYVGNFDSSGKAADVSPVSWFSLPAGSFTVKARVEQTFDYTVNVPRTAAIGGHYAAVFVETIPPAGSGGAFVSRIERIGTLFYVNVRGEVRQDGSVMPLEVARLQSVGPVRGALRLHNDGNLHFLAEGTARLTGPFGADAGKAVPLKGEVLPGTTRRFDLALPAPAPIGLYKVTATVKYLGRTEEVSRWMLLMPRVTFVIVGGTVLLLLGVGLWALVRRARRLRS